MDVYRVYMVGFTGHFESVEVLHCASDGEAMFLARGKISDFPRAEVWAGARRVGELTRQCGAGQSPPLLSDLAVGKGAERRE